MRTKSIKWVAVIVAVAVCAGLAVMPALAADDDPPINLELKDVNVKIALEALFKMAGRTNFVIDHNVDGIMPSVSFNNISFENALKSLIRSAGLSMRMEGDLINISKKAEVPAVTAASSAPVVTDVSVDTTVTTETTIELVPLFHSGASEILSMMNGDWESNNNNNNRFGGGYGGGGGFGNSGFGGGGGFGNSGFGGGGGFGGNSGFGNSGGYGNYGGSNRGW